MQTNLTMQSIRVRHTRGHKGGENRNKRRKPTNRPGFTDDRGLVFLAPRNPKKLAAWFDRYEVPEGTRTTYRLH